MGSDLRGIGLRGAHLEGRSLAGADLRGADLRGAELYEVDLRGCDLEGADLSGALLHSCELAQAELSRARLCRSALIDCSLDSATAEAADLTDALSWPGWPEALRAGTENLPPALDPAVVPLRAVLKLARALRGLELGPDAALDPARALAEEAADLAPRWARPLITLGELLVLRGDVPAAVAAYEQALQRDGTDLRCARLLAQALVSLGQAGRAVALLEAVLQRGGHPPRRRRELVWDLGAAALRASRLAEAERWLDEAAQLGARLGLVDVDLLMRQAAVAARRGQLPLAMARLREARELAPERPDVLRALGELCHGFLQDPEAAASVYAAYLAEQPRDRLVWLRKAAVDLDRGAVQSALHAFAQADALPPSASPQEAAAASALQARRAELCDAALDFRALRTLTAGAEDGRSARLHARALLALDDPALAGYLLRLAARPDLDPETRHEVELLQALPHGWAPEPAAPRHEPPATGAPPGAVRLLAAAQHAGLCTEAARLRGVRVSPYGSLLLLLTAEPGGAVLEFGLGRGQAALIAHGAGRAESQRGASALWRPERIAGELLLSIEDPPAQAVRWSFGAATGLQPATGSGLLDAAAAVVADGAEAPCLRALADAHREHFAAAARAAWQRCLPAERSQAARWIEEAPDEPLTLLSPLALPDEADVPRPFTGGAALGPAWLQALLQLLRCENHRDELRRFGALLPEPARWQRLRPLLGARGPGADRELLCAAATLALLGALAPQAALLVESEPLLGPVAVKARQLAVELLADRLEMLARGVVSAWLRREERVGSAPSD